MRGACFKGPPGPRAVLPPVKDMIGEPAKVGAYLQYARENVDRSRLLFQRADLRYAVFSANEGLELCVKAYLLHYKAIAVLIVTGHLPHKFLIRSMRESLAQFERGGPGDTSLVLQMTSNLDKLGDLFGKLEKHKAKVALWKKSVGADLGRNDQKVLDSLRPLATEWGGQEPQARPGFPQEKPSGFMQARQGELRDTLLKMFHQKFERADGSRTIPLPGVEGTVVEALYHGRLTAQMELFLHTTAIVNGYVHQQISRYLTQIDGVDSSEVYARHRDGAGRLLAKICGACGALLPHLDNRLPPPPPPLFPRYVREALGRE